MLDLDTLRYIPARYQGDRGSKHPTLIVVHTGETGEGDTAAEGMAAFFAGGPDSKASTHLVGDNNSIVRCVPDARRANGAGGANGFGLHYEQAGRAGQTSSDWADTYSKATIRNCARACAAWSARYAIPVDRRLTPAEIAATIRAGGSPRGICAHVDITDAMEILHRENRGHWDPGPNYPWPVLLAQIADELSQTTPAPTPPPLEDDDMAKFVSNKGSIFMVDGPTIVGLDPAAWAACQKIYKTDPVPITDADLKALIALETRAGK